jgi:hypothetical protein
VPEAVPGLGRPVQMTLLPFGPYPLHLHLTCPNVERPLSSPGPALDADRLLGKRRFRSLCS